MNWNLPKQTFLVENGQPGDCWRCCIAAILQVPAETVPHFLKLEREGGKSMDHATQKWLNEKGYCLIRAADLFQFHYFWDTSVEPPPYIACGPTERSRGMGKHHAVVMVDQKIVYDPHPSNAGLTAISYCYLIMPLFDRFHKIDDACNCGGLCPACAAEKPSSPHLNATE